ncbi:MAG: DUF3592 domain-containing protein [Candidatus Brocadiia bacterium]
MARRDNTPECSVGAAIFLLVLSWGLMAIYCIFGLPFLIKAWKAHWWVQTPCVVVSVDPIRHHYGKMHVDFYGPALSYSYEFRGAKYVADRYCPSCSYKRIDYGNDPGFTDPELVRKYYPPGRMMTCYVNPNEPSEAVIERSFTKAQVYAMILIPSLFVFCGVVVPIWNIRSATSRKAE